MRLARLDHDPLSGIAPITLASNIRQPQHVYIGEVLHPMRETAEKDRKRYATIVADWPQVLNRLGNNVEIAQWLNCCRHSVMHWRGGKYAPNPETAAAIVALYRKRFRGPVPGLREAS